METDIRGTGVALITPFKENFEVDYDALERLVEHVIEGGVDYLVVMGTTGESVTLSDDEKISVVQHVLECNRGRKPVVLGHGGNDTKSIIEGLSKFDLDKFTAILSVSPMYNRPNQRGIYEHYKAFASHCEAPIILYNVPGRTGSNIEVDTILQLANDVDNIVAVKEASGDIIQMQRVIARAPEGFQVLAGDDALAVPLVSVGGIGVISVIANAFPKIISSAVRSALNNDYKSAQELHYQLLDLMNLTFEDGNPGGVKCMLKELGILENVLRLPLVPVRPDVELQIHQAVKALGR
jgi:4-hydroxy-tetrahydrodipicolinate synthase